MRFVVSCLGVGTPECINGYGEKVDAEKLLQGTSLGFLSALVGLLAHSVNLSILHASVSSSSLRIFTCYLKYSPFIQNYAFKFMAISEVYCC